jgi:cofilin
MSSGVAVSDDVLTKYQELKLGHSLRYALFKLSPDQSSVVVDTTAPPSATYDDFVKALPANDCRYAVFDFAYEADGGNRNKILFVVWAPDSAKIKAKMLYASTKDAVRKKLVGVGVEIQATDLAEIDREAVLEKVLRV